jgi:hypothetical protein
MPDEVSHIHQSVDIRSVWTIVENYDLTSRMPSCSLTNTGLRPNDIGVFRPSLPIGYIDQEGSFDVSQLAIEEGARLLGWVPKEEAEDLAKTYRGRARDANLGKAQIARKLNRLEARIAELEGELDIALAREDA